MIGVLVVDDHPVTRWGVEHLLGRVDGIEVLASVGSPAEAPVALDGREPDALAAGADGYLTKDSDDCDVVAALRTVAAGGFWLSSSVAGALEAHLETSGAGTVTGPDGVPQALSRPGGRGARLHRPRLTHSQSAARMGISASTVDSYVERIRRKLGLGNKAELTAKAIELRLTGKVEPGVQTTDRGRSVERPAERSRASTDE